VRARRRFAISPSKARRDRVNLLAQHDRA